MSTKLQKQQHKVLPVQSEANPPTRNPSVIEAAKAEESQTSLVLIMRDGQSGDLDALKVIEAWRLIKPLCKDRPLKPGEQINDALTEMWVESQCDITAIADKTGLSLGTAVSVFNRLRKARMIYPDGSAHRGASAIVSNEVAAYLKTFLHE